MKRLFYVLGAMTIASMTLFTTSCKNKKGVCKEFGLVIEKHTVDELDDMGKTCDDLDKDWREVGGHCKLR